jgi:hypothetical protein
MGLRSVAAGNAEPGHGGEGSAQNLPFCSNPGQQEVKGIDDFVAPIRQ